MACCLLWFGTPGDDASKTDSVAPSDTSDLSGELVFAIWDNNLMEYIEANDMEAKFQEKYPNATIEVEKIKDDSEYRLSSASAALLSIKIIGIAPVPHSGLLPFRQLAEAGDDVLQAVYRVAEGITGFVGLLVPLGAG